uniref:Uncharacterized protein n=1 Tax=Micrurus spixii TaxID=129469 RepID=A0A2D4LKC1_9SAUR
MLKLHVCAHVCMYVCMCVHKHCMFKLEICEGICIFFFSAHINPLRDNPIEGYRPSSVSAVQVGRKMVFDLSRFERKLLVQSDPSGWVLKGGLEAGSSCS